MSNMLCNIWKTKKKKEGKEKKGQVCNLNATKAFHATVHMEYKNIMLLKLI